MTADIKLQGPQYRSPEKPAYDGGRFGMKPKFEVLMEKIRKGRPARVIPRDETKRNTGPGTVVPFRVMLVVPVNRARSG